MRCCHHEDMYMYTHVYRRYQHVPTDAFYTSLTDVPRLIARVVTDDVVEGSVVDMGNLTRVLSSRDVRHEDTACVLRRHASCHCQVILTGKAPTLSLHVGTCTMLL